MRRGALAPLEFGERVLIRHGDPVVGLAAVAQILGGVDLLETELLALGPGERDGRPDRDRAMAGLGEGAGQGEPLARGDQAIVEALIVDPEAALERAMGEPGLPAHGRRGEIARGHVQAVPGQLGLERPQARQNGGRVALLLERAAAVGLEVHQEHVGIAEAREQLPGGHPGEGIARCLPFEGGQLGQAFGAAAPLVQEGLAGHGRDCPITGKGLWRHLLAEQQERHGRSARERGELCAAFFQAALRRVHGDQADQEYDDQNRARTGQGEPAERATERAGQEADNGGYQVKVEERVEGPAQARANHELRKLEEDDQGRSAAHQPAKPAARPAAAQGRDQGEQSEQGCDLERNRGEALEVELGRLDRQDPEQREPRECAGESQGVNEPRERR